MKKILLLTLGVIVLLPACRKIFYNEYHVTGQVIDKFSEEPVPGAHVELLATAGAGSGYGVVDTFSTDNEGCFDFWFSPAGELVYDIRPAYYEYYDNHDAEKHVGLFEKNKNHTLELHPLGWVKVNFINEPPLDTVSSLAINGVRESGIGTFTYWQDTTLFGTVRCCEEKKIVWQIRRGNDYEKEILNMYFSSHDTISINVKY